MAVDDAEPGLAVDPVVDGEVARSADRAGEVDGLRRLQPRRADGSAQQVDLAAGQGECVAGVVDAPTSDVEEVAAVVDARDLLVDDRMELADGGDRDARVERLPRRDPAYALGEVGRLGGEHVGHGVGRPDVRVGAAQVVGGPVVGMLVGDEHGGRAVGGAGVGEDARIDDDDHTVVLDPHARVPELRDPHGVQTRPAECPANRVTRGVRG